MSLKPSAGVSASEFRTSSDASAVRWRYYIGRRECLKQSGDVIIDSMTIVRSEPVKVVVISHRAEVDAGGDPRVEGSRHQDSVPPMDIPRTPMRPGSRSCLVTR